MALIVPIGNGVRTALASCANNGWLENVHPGLVLHKFPLTYDADNKLDWSKDVQRPSAERVVRLSGSPPAGFPFSDFLRRWKSATAGGVTFSATTIGPLTLHLARAAALENAGLCLHPLYGFAYLPGSGLKGMAHAYAETVWLSAQPDQKQAWRRIEDIFGWAPTPDRRQQINDPNHPAEVRREDDHDPKSPEIKASSGSIIFHDAWPESWPQLIVDIVNNHHSDYYQAAPNDNDHPPGDWENPVPVYFLAVKPGATFTFSLSKRRADMAGELLDLARQWLLGALCHLGAGAKTAAGYGCFRPADKRVSIPPMRRAAWTGVPVEDDNLGYEFPAEVRLVTPAFLGGPNRHAEETVRLTSVKALLRTWWRAWHGHLTTQQLRQREAQIFGSIQVGCGLSVLPLVNSARLKLLPKGENMGGGGSPLGYLGYGPIGYDKGSKANRTQVPALDADQSFEFRLVHRSQVGLKEVLKSLWLLGALGGLGSRNRRGWGSILLGSAMVLDGLPQLGDCRTIDEYRAALQNGLNSLAPAADRNTASELRWTALSPETRIVLSRETFSTWRAAMEDLGTKFQVYRAYDNRAKFADNPKQNPGPDYHSTKALLSGQGTPPSKLPERAGFGLPYAQAYRSLGGARATFTPFWKEGNKSIKGRRASPVFCKIVRLADGKFIWQVAFLPARFLPEGAKVGWAKDNVPLPNSPFPEPGPFGIVRNPANPQETLLKEFLDWLESAPVSVRGRAGRENRSQGVPSPGQQIPSRGPNLPRHGEWVEAVLLAEKTKKGGWRARHVATGIAGPIQNSSDVPDEIRPGKKAEPGDTVTLIVQSANEREIAFRYPTPGDEQKARQAGGGPRGDPDGHRPRGRK